MRNTRLEPERDDADTGAESLDTARLSPPTRSDTNSAVDELEVTCHIELVRVGGKTRYRIVLERTGP